MERGGVGKNGGFGHRKSCGKKEEGRGVEEKRHLRSRASSTTGKTAKNISGGGGNHG